MNNYKSIKLAIYSYLLKDEVIDNENVISAYTLYKALDSKFNYYKKRQNDIIKSFIDKKSYTYKINKATKDSICFLVFDGDKYFYTINKDNNNLTGNTTDGFINTNYCSLMSLFSLKEEASSLYKLNCSTVASSYSDELFKFALVTNGLDFSTDFLFDLKDIYKIRGANLRSFILDARVISLLYKYKDVILKRFSIDVDKLNDSYKLIVNEYLENKDKKKIKCR